MTAYEIIARLERLDIKKIDHDKDVLGHTACLVANPIKKNSFAYLFDCTTIGQFSDSMKEPI